MGRPLNSNLFGSPLDTDDNDPILVFNSAIIGGETVNFPYIQKQKGPNRYIASNGVISGEVVLKGYDPINEGDASMKVITPSGNVVYAIKIYENTVECSDGNTYYWNKYNYVSNTDTVTVNSMVPSQYKAATGTSTTGGKISTISTSLSTMVFQNDPTMKNVAGVGGAGYGATFDISATNRALYTPTSINLLTGGINYRYGEIISVPNVGNIKVTEIMSNLNYITSIEPTVTTAPSLTDYQGTFNGIGGTGVNSSFLVVSQESVQHQASSVTIVDAGTGYKVGDKITVDNVGTLSITDVDSSTDAITQATVPSPSTLFAQDPSSTNVAVSGGTGNGATFTVSAEKVYTPNSVTTITGGTGYVIGDVLTIANTGTISVTAVDTGTHTITGVDFEASDIYYSSTDISGDISIASTSGTAATLAITSTLTDLYYPTSITLLDGGAGYSVGDVVEVGNSGKATVTALAKSGSITNLSFTSTSQYYTSDVSGTGVTATGGTGTGATFNIVTTPTTLYTGQNATILSGGTGYTVGQVLTISDFGTIKVASIGTNGVISSVNVISRATTSVDASAETSVSPQATSNGTGATFSVTTTSAQYYVISQITTTNSGSAYVKGDVLTIGSTASVTVTEVSQAGTIATATIVLSTTTIPTNEEGTVSGTGGTGTKSTFTVKTTSTTSGYVVSAVSVVSGGTGFSVNQVISENFGTITVSTISPGTGSITAFKFSPISGTSTNDMSESSVAGSGGTGTGATFKVTSTPQYQISSITLNDGGNGYSIGDSLTLLAYQLETFKVPSLGKVTVTAVQTNDYHVISLTLSNNVISQIDMASDNLSVTGGSGTGLSIKVNSNLVEAYNVVSIVMNSEGTGYSVGDVLTVGNAGTVKITSVGSIIGQVTSVSLLQPAATYYQDMASSKLAVVGGYGTGMTLSVTSGITNQYYISSISLNSQGTGYATGDIIRVGNSGRVTVSSITS